MATLLAPIETQQVDNLTYYLPRTNEEVAALLRQAKQQNQKVVVRGAAHSFPLIAQAEAETNCLFMTLAHMCAVSLNQQTGYVTVGAGCHLGYDPYDPTNLSTVANSLSAQLDPLTSAGLHQLGAAAWALPDLGGISHQTVGGFMATGSSGGSLTYSFDSAIQSVTVLSHGADDVVTTTYTRPVPDNPDDPFYAVAFAHRGLLGVVVEVGFQCEPTFDIVGKETVSSLHPTNQSPIDLFGDEQPDPARPTLTNFLQGPASGGADYSRLIWWPQPGLERMVIWQADRAKVDQEQQPFPVPYKEVPYYFGSPLLSTLGADVLMTALGQWQTWLGDLIGTNNNEYQAFIAIGKSLMPNIMTVVLDQFVHLPTPVHNFSDVWWKGLPMDNQMSDRLFPVWFTELWIPMDQPGKAEEVMRTMRDFYQDASHPERAGTFCCEIYAAPKSPFWMSPAYGYEVIRMDIFWFAGNTDGIPQDYYQQFWELLAPYNFRPHWGKYLPAPDGPQGVAYLQSQYPKWDAVMALRQQLDPHDLFLTDYWQQHLLQPTT